MIRSTLVLASLIGGTVHAGVTAAAVQVAATNHTPAEVPFEVRPMNAQNPGIEITWLLSGENIASLKEGSLVVESLSGAKDVTLPAKDTVTFDKFFSKVSDDGAHAKFSIRLPMDKALDAVAGLKLRGRITVVTGSDAATASGELAAGATEVKVGDVTISRAKAAKGFFGGDDKSLALTFTGTSASTKSIAILAKNGKELKSNGSMGFNGVITRYYPAAGADSPVTVKVVVWKSTAEVDVPIAYGR